MAMAMKGEYLGLSLAVEEIDHENLGYFQACGKHEFRLQRCLNCGLLRYPPGTGCPWCADGRNEWVLVEGKGTVHSYGEVHHAILPQFKAHTPYMLLLVDLDTQKGQPTEHESLRIVGNLVTPDGQLAPHETVKRCGIGTRVKMVFCDVGDGFAIPNWTIDEDAPQPEKPWRYPQE